MCILWCLPTIKNNKEQRKKPQNNQATVLVSVNSFQSLSALNRDYKCDTSGLEHLHKSWPGVSWGNDTPASGKPHVNNAHARSWKCPKLDIRHYRHFINNHTMISPGVPPYVKSDCEWKHGSHSHRFPSCAAVRCPQSREAERERLRLHLRASLCSKSSASFSAPMGRWNNR